jgi:Zn-dependent alcohol dehydrogenase
MGKDWEIIEMDLDPPKEGEVLIRPLETVALVGCGVPTGWGTAVNASGVRPGDTTVIYGIGGVGINAVQGAAFAGAQRHRGRPAGVQARERHGVRRHARRSLRGRRGIDCL